MKSIQKYLFTGAVVLIAVAVVLLKCWTHLTNPWTRDGQVQANVIQIAPRVSGPIVTLPIRDNQFVRALAIKYSRWRIEQRVACDRTIPESTCQLRPATSHERSFCIT
jgi:hypothetical protein